MKTDAVQLIQLAFQFFPTILVKVPACLLEKSIDTLFTQLILSNPANQKPCSFRPRSSAQGFPSSEDLHWLNRLYRSRQCMRSPASSDGASLSNEQKKSSSMWQST